MEGFMKKNIVCQSVVLAIMCMLFAGMACNKTTGPNTTPNALVVLQPTAGQSFKVGDTMHVKWQVNDTNDISSVVVQLYGFPNDTLITTLGNGSFPPDSASYSWIIDSAAVAAHCYIRICNYEPYGSYPDSSSLFTITY
jgi:hypothetical protein